MTVKRYILRLLFGGELVRRAEHEKNARRQGGKAQMASNTQPPVFIDVQARLISHCLAIWSNLGALFALLTDQRFLIASFGRDPGLQVHQARRAPLARSQQTSRSFHQGHSASAHI